MKNQTAVHSLQFRAMPPRYLSSLVVAVPGAKPSHSASVQVLEQIPGVSFHGSTTGNDEVTVWASHEGADMRALPPVHLAISTEEK